MTLIPTWSVQFDDELLGVHPRGDTATEHKSTKEEQLQYPWYSSLVSRWWLPLCFNRHHSPWQDQQRTTVLGMSGWGGTLEKRLHSKVLLTWLSFIVQREPLHLSIISNWPPTHKFNTLSHHLDTLIGVSWALGHLLTIYPLSKDEIPFFSDLDLEREEFDLNPQLTMKFFKTLLLIHCNTSHSSGTS